MYASFVCIKLYAAGVALYHQSTRILRSRYNYLRVPSRRIISYSILQCACVALAGPDDNGLQMKEDLEMEQNHFFHPQLA